MFLWDIGVVASLLSPPWTSEKWGLISGLQESGNTTKAEAGRIGFLIMFLRMLSILAIISMAWLLQKGSLLHTIASNLHSYDWHPAQQEHFYQAKNIGRQL